MTAVSRGRRSDTELWLLACGDSIPPPPPFSLLYDALPFNDSAPLIESQLDEVDLC